MATYGVYAYGTQPYAGLLGSGTQNVDATGIASGEAFGDHVVDQGQVIQATGIASGEAFGSADVSPGAVNVDATGIASGEAFGSATVEQGFNIDATGIDSEEAFGSATVSTSYSIVASGFSDSAPVASDTVNFVDSDEQNVNDDTSMTFTVPAGASNGDLMLVHITKFGTHPPYAPDDTWKEEAYAYTGTRHAKIFSKIRDGDTTVTFTWGSSTNKKAVGSLAVFSGASGVADVTHVEESTPPAATVGLHYPRAGSMIFYAANADYDAAWSIDASVTTIANQTSTASNAVSHATAYERITSDGESASRSFDGGSFTGVFAVQLQPLEYQIPTFTLPGIWHWGQVSPRFVNNGNKLYVSAAYGNGDTHVRSYDLSSGSEAMAEIQGFSPDDHVHAALIVPSDKAPIVAYSDHNNDSVLRYRIGSSTDDITSLGSEQTITFVTTSYALAFADGDDVLFMTRKNNSTWSLSYSSNYGSTFSATQDLFDVASGQMYVVGTQLDDGTVRIVAMEDPATDGGMSTYFDIDIPSGNIYDVDGALVDNFKSPSALPIRITDQPAIVDAAGSINNRVFDISKSEVPAVLFSLADDNDGHYYIARYDDAATPTWVSYPIASTNLSIQNNGGGTMTPGACFVDGRDDQVILSREQDGVWSIELWVTDDYSTWTLDKTFKKSTSRLVRPDYTNGYVAWSNIFNYSNYDDFDGRVEVYPLSETWIEGDDFYEIGEPSVDASNTIVSTGIDSGEAFGSHTVAPGAANIDATGIASAEAFGSAAVSIQVNQTIYLGGDGELGGGELGGGELGGDTSYGIDSGEAFGSAAVSATYDIAATGIASGEAFGSHEVTPGTVNIDATGIASGEAFGDHVVSATYAIDATGIASGEAFGSHEVSVGAVNIDATGIASGEAFGSHEVDTGSVIEATGIASAEAFGEPDLAYIVDATGIVSGEAFGSHDVVPGAVNIDATGITSGEAFGSHVVLGVFEIEATGIASEEAFGEPDVSFVVSATGIESGEDFGDAEVTTSYEIVAGAGIASGEAFGSAIVVSRTITGLIVQTVLFHSPVQTINVITPEQTVVTIEPSHTDVAQESSTVYADNFG